MKTKRKKTPKNKNSIKELKTQITELKDDVEKYNNKYLRLLAEFDNYKKRSSNEKNNLIKYEGIDVIKSILPILDDLDRTLKIPELKQNKSIYKGVNMIFEKINLSLADIGVVPFNSVNKKFDISLHEALMTKKSKKKSNIILEEFEKGYKYHDKIIRHAKVVVSE